MNRNTLIFGAVSVLAITGMAIADTESGQAGSGNGCEIAKTTQNGTINIESRYNEESAGSGSYKVTIRTLSGSNRVNSTQRGHFSKNAGESALLGKTRLSTNGSSYEVKLDVTFNGKRHKCSQKIDATI